MGDIKFPFFKTKIDNSSRKFNLTNFKERQEYFEFKAGPKIRKLREYLKNNSFIAYLLGKKNSGKGTYAKMFGEIVDPEKVVHISIGDLVRRVHQEVISDQNKKKELIEWLGRDYRGYISIEEVIRSLLNRSAKTLLPTEFILTLVRKEISGLSKKTLFIDGFPRDLDQISYSLFFRDLINYRQDPDIFILIDVPESVIDQRIKYRVVCPQCQTSRNLKLLPTSKIGYEEQGGEYLICDNPNCQGSRMVQKEGDELGIKAIARRLELDEKLMKKAFSLYGIPKVLLRNSIPVKEAEKFVDDYEITPEYRYERSAGGDKIKIIEKPWQIIDDEGVLSYSLLPPPVVVSMIKQIADVLNL